tara:strand:- start:15942 stop:16703 length:762 start_codon:yes stop_codon:yes gene_type:complete
LNNAPKLWLDHLPTPDNTAHKYSRGCVTIYSAPEMTGASNLAAQSCARIGAGLVNVLSTKHNANLYKSILPPHIIVRDNMNWFDERITARLYGSGGLGTDINFTKNIPTILDADALQKNILGHLNEHYILTPHDGEFRRLFPTIDLSNRKVAAREAAQQSGAYIVLKGAKTIIAAPNDAHIVTNDHASPYLASAGTGDVLAGMITGLCAQGMPPFYAACAAVWIHGEAGKRIGAGLVASDIPDKTPEILKSLS